MRFSEARSGANHHGHETGNVDDSHGDDGVPGNVGLHACPVKPIVGVNLPERDGVGGHQAVERVDGDENEAVNKADAHKVLTHDGIGKDSLEFGKTRIASLQRGARAAADKGGAKGHKERRKDDARIWNGAQKAHDEQVEHRDGQKIEGFAADGRCGVAKPVPAACGGQTARSVAVSH